MRLTSAIAALSCAILVATAARAAPVSEGDAALHRGDYKQALTLLEGPAQRGNAVAELDLGILYFGGKGVPRDRHEAAHWFLAAARQGQNGALANAGILYVTGTGVPRNVVRAYMWFSLAADVAPGGYAGRYRDHVAGEMTPNEIADANKLAMQCKSSGYTACASVECLAGPMSKTFGGSSWQIFACGDGRSLAFVASPGSPAAPFDFTLSYYGDGSAITWGGEGNDSASAAAREEVKALTAAQRVALYSAASATPTR